MNTPHIHSELIKAWADGAQIQYKYINGSDSWDDDDNPCWHDPRFEFRIKPKPKLVFKYFVLESNPLLGLRFTQCEITDCTPNAQYIKATFDYETSKLLALEIA